VVFKPAFFNTRFRVFTVAPWRLPPVTGIGDIPGICLFKIENYAEHVKQLGGSTVNC
jgi:hypothetical protein